MVRLEDLLDQVVLKTLKPSAMVEALTRRGPVSPEQHARELQFLSSAVEVGAISANVEKAMGNHLRAVQARAAAPPAAPSRDLAREAAAGAATPTGAPAPPLPPPDVPPAAVPQHDGVSPQAAAAPAAATPTPRDEAPAADPAPAPPTTAPPLASHVPPPAIPQPAAQPPNRARAADSDLAPRRRRGGYGWIVLVVVLLGGAAVLLPYVRQQIYHSQRVRTATALRHDTYASLEEASAAVDRLHDDDRDLFLHNPDGPVVHYVRAAVKAALGPSPDLSEYRHALDTLHAAAARFYGENAPATIIDLQRQLDAKFAQAKLNRIGDLHKRAAERRFLPSGDTQPSVVEILATLRDARADENGAQAMAQLEGVSRDFDGRVFNARAQDLPGLRHARDLFAHVYDSNNPRIGVRLADFSAREQQFMRLASAQAGTRAREDARAQALADFVAEAHTEPLELADIERILAHRDAAARAGAPARQLDPIAQGIADRLAKQLSSSAPTGKEAIEATLKRVIAGLRLFPDSPDLERMRVQLESRLDTAMRPAERADAALAELQAATSTANPDASWLAIYDARIDEVQRAVPGGLAARPAVQAAVLSRLLAVGSGAARAGNDSLAQAAQIELRRIAPDDPANAQLAKALDDAHAGAKLGDLQDAQSAVSDFITNPLLTGDSRGALATAIGRLLTDGADRSRLLIAQLASTLAGQVAARMGARQFDGADEYLQLLRRLPGTADTSADLARRLAQAQLDAVKDQAHLARVATLDEITTAVQATRASQALSALAAFKAQSPGTPEVAQAVTSVADGLDVLAAQSLVGARSDNRTQLQGALNLVQQALALQKAPERLALQDKIKNLIEVAETRQRAVHASTAMSTTAGSGRMLDALVERTRSLNPDKVKVVQRAVDEIRTGRPAAPAGSAGVLPLPPPAALSAP